MNYFSLKKNQNLLKILVSIVFYVFVASSPVQGQQSSFSLNGTLFEKVGHAAQIDPYLLYSIALVESGFHPTKTTMIAPYPWVLRMPNAPYYGVSQVDAQKQLEKELKKSKLVDVGLMQINVKWHGHRVKRTSDLLEPETNLRVASEILNELLNRYPNNALTAIGQYHSSDRTRSMVYADRVWQTYQRILLLSIKSKK